MNPETLLQILALVQAHKQQILSNPRMTTLTDPYISDYETYLNDLERESGQDLGRFRIPPSAIKSRIVGTQTFNEYFERTSNNRSERFCERAYFLGKLDALLIYMQSPPPEWPSHVG